MVVEVEAAVVAVRVTPMPNRRGWFLKKRSIRSLLSRTSTTPKKCTPSSQQPRRPSTGSSGTQERNAVPVAGSPVSVRPTFLTLLLPFPLLCRLFLCFLTRPSALPMKRSPTMTHPTARTLPWFVRPKRPKAKIDPTAYCISAFQTVRLAIDP